MILDIQHESYKHLPAEDFLIKRFYSDDNLYNGHFYYGLSINDWLYNLVNFMIHALLWHYIAVTTIILK